MNVSRAGCLTALLGACAASASHAQTTAEASVRNVAWELVDLTPDDGIAPAVSFEVTGNYNFERPRLSLGTTDSATRLSRYEEATGPLFEPLVRSIHQAEGTPARALDASAVSALSLQSGMRTWAQANSAPDTGLAAAYALSGYVHFILAPNSALKLSADLSASGTLDRVSQAGYTYASAYLLYFTNVPETGDAWYNYTFDSVEYEAGASPEGVLARHVQGMISNATAAPTVNAFAFNAHVITNTAPVPEPGTYAMLAAGLLVLGAAARGRRCD